MSETPSRGTVGDALRLIPIGLNGEPDQPLAGAVPAIVHDVMGALAKMYARVSFLPPWMGYLAVEENCVVGTCAFKHPPIDGVTEIAYFTFPGFEGRGIATHMVRQLVSIAAAAHTGIRLTARTQPEENASTAVLRRVGFHYVGPIHDAEDGVVWAWEYRPLTDRNW